MNDRRTSAHPILEPLNYEILPENTHTFLGKDQLSIYELIWNAGIATAIDGPALREEQLAITLNIPSTQLAADSTLNLLAIQTNVVEPGWGILLPSDMHRYSGSPTSDSLGMTHDFPETLIDALDETGDSQLDSTGRRFRSMDQCEPITLLLMPTATWKAEVASINNSGLSVDQAIELMANNGIGRPSTFADRFTAAVENDLIVHEADRLIVGDYGQEILEILARLPDNAIVNAVFSSELEKALQTIEDEHSLAGEILCQFSERALGTVPALADWLDEQVIDGQSFNEALSLADAILPPANSWASFALPTGLSPEVLIKNKDESILLRTQLDSALAAPDRKSWKQLSSRQRAALRLVAIAKDNSRYSTEDLASRASRDVVLRWWIDLAPRDSPLTTLDLEMADSFLATIAPDTMTDIRLIATKLNQTL